MKNQLFTLLLICVFSAGCYKDKGNYDYTELPEVTVTGLKEGEKFTAYVGEPFRIPVTVEVKNGNLADFSYEWKIEKEVVSTEKDLDIMINKSARYAQLDVIHNETGVRHVTFFEIAVSSPFQKGWLILSDMGDKSQLCFLREDNVFVENVYYLQNNEYLSGGAYVLCEHFLPWSSEIGQVFIACQQAPGYSVEIDGNTLQKMIHTNQEFVDGAPGDFLPQSMNCVMNWDYLISNGKLYTREQPNGTDAQYQEGSFLNFPVAGDYELLPWTMMGNLVFNPDVLAFDKKTCSYVLLRSGEMKTFDTSRDETKAFNPSDMGKMLLGGGVYSSASNRDDFVTFLKDMNTGKIYVQKFFFWGWTNRSFYTESEVEFPEPDLIDKDTKFVVCTGRNYAYFANGKTLYSYNHKENIVEPLRTDFHTVIREIAISRANPERLAVALENAEDASKSDFMVLDVSVVGKGKVIEGTEVKGKCGRVVDVIYKIGDQWSI